jgi:hypothetical protein
MFALIFTSSLFFAGDYWIEQKTLSKSFTNYKFQSFKNNNSLLLNVGQFIYNLLPNKFIQTLEQEYSELKRSNEELLQTLTQALLIFGAFILLTFIYKNILLLIMALLLIVLILVEPKFALQVRNKNISENLEHLFACMKVLIIKTETPLLMALELIYADMPSTMSSLKEEIGDLITRIKQLGTKEALKASTSSIALQQDLISFLLAANEGASKAALKDQMTLLEKKFIEAKTIKQKTFIENLQLYLIMPILLLLFVVLMPMIFALNHMMQSSQILT